MAPTRTFTTVVEQKNADTTAAVESYDNENAPVVKTIYLFPYVYKALGPKLRVIIEKAD